MLDAPIANIESMKLAMRFDPASEFCVSFDDVLRLGVWARTSIDRFLRRFRSMSSCISSPAESPLSARLQIHEILSIMSTRALVLSTTADMCDMMPERSETSILTGENSTRMKLSVNLWMLPLLASV